MRFSSLSGAVLMAVAAASAEEATTTTPVPACTALSSTSNGAFFDLRPDIAKKATTGKVARAITKDYHARGYDYGKNFTLNICDPVVAPVQDVVGLQKAQWANVSAYYTYKDQVYSIGSSSQDLHSRGRKLVLRYSGGSPCAAASNKSTREQKPASGDKTGAARPRQKSTVISFLCDRDSLSSQAAFSFVGTDADECAYFFEARSIHACALAEPHKPGNVGPGSVFGLILVIAVLVYAIGGVCYNRTVAHARGWRQLPNYSLWAGIWSFVTDMFAILTSSCARFLPGRRGYSTVGQSSNSNRDSDAENRLIDQLDEEWDD